MIVGIVAFLFMASSVASSAPSTRVTEARQAQVDGLFREYDASNRPGYAVGIIENGALVYAKGFGSANLDYDLPLSSTSVFNVASLSKQFTAAAVACLVLDGELHLTDPVHRHIPELPDVYRAVELQHLIYMTSGLPEYYRLERPGARDWHLDHFTVEQALDVVFAADLLEFEPGTRWAYSNANYQLLSEIVTRVSGVPFSEYLRREIFEPLGMSDSHVNDDVRRIVRGRVTGYNQNEDGSFGQEIRRSPHYGGSGLFTTIEDLAKWDLSLRNGTLREGRLAELMLETRRFEHDKANDAFGLVWGEYRGHRTLWYEGGDLGFSSYMVRFPDDDFSVIVLSNLGTGRSFERAREVLNVMFPGR